MKQWIKLSAKREQGGTNSVSMIAWVSILGLFHYGISFRNGHIDGWTIISLYKAVRKLIFPSNINLI